VTRDPRRDALRGVAMLGVFTLNAPYFLHSPLAGLAGVGPPGPGNALPFVLLLAHGKFWSVLGLLFGAGIADQDPARNTRRMLGLLVLGVGHALLWPGDALVCWSIVGVLTGLSARLRPQGVAALAAVALAVGAIATVGSDLCGHGTGICAPFAAREGLRQSVLRDTGWGHHARAMAAMWAYLPTDVPPLLATSLLGAWSVRTAARLPTATIALGPAGLLPALPQALRLFGVYVLSAAVADGLAVAAVPLIALALVAALASSWTDLRGVAPPFIAVGRMSLSNYLFQSLLATTAAPLAPHSSLAVATALGAAAFGAQAGLSMAWLRRSHQGPVEAFLRAWSEPASSRRDAALPGDRPVRTT
jgi:uncharacterized protein